MSDLTFASPVTKKPAANPSASLTVSDETATAKILVKGDGAAQMGVSYGTSRRDGESLICGSRPGEVTVIAPLSNAASVMAAAPSGGHTTVLDWSHRSAMFRLTGADATRTLAKLCSLDLSDDMFPNGAVASASIGGVGTDMVRDDVNGTLSLLLGIDRSFGQYWFDTLLDAGGEFGIGVV